MFGDTFNPSGGSYLLPFGVFIAINRPRRAYGLKTNPESRRAGWYRALNKRGHNINLPSPDSEGDCIKRAEDRGRAGDQCPNGYFPIIGRVIWGGQ